MKWCGRVALLVPVVLAAVFWVFPPGGDDAYYHSVNAVEEVRAWQEGAALPRYHRAWNGGTGSFAPTIYSPIPMVVQGGAAWLIGDGQRAVGVSLALALLVAAVVVVCATRKPETALLAATPYVLAVALTRATTTEAWALAGAAGVLVLGLPTGSVTWRRGLGLAAAVVLVAGSQIGMLVQLCWLMAAAWLTWLVLSRRSPQIARNQGFPVLLKTLAWAAAGFLSAAVFWLPAIIDGRNLALDELVEGPFAWSGNFLPGNSELSLLFTVTAVCLGATVVIVVMRGEGEQRLPLVASAVTALVLTVGLSAPLWHLPGMRLLQFPWRFLGPATVVMIIAVASLSGRWRWLAAALLVLPSALVPLRLESLAGGVSVSLTPNELAGVVHDRWGLAPVLPSARGLYAPGFHRLASLQELAVQEAAVIPEERSVFGGVWRVTGVAGSSVLLPLQWWPEWKLMVDEREISFTNHGGLVAIDCPPGTAAVRAVLMPSASRSLGVVVSLAGLLALVALAWFEGRQR